MADALVRNGNGAFGGLKIVEPDADLPKPAGTFGPAARVPGLLDGGKQQSHEDGDDRQNDEDFQQCECDSPLYHDSYLQSP